MRIGMVAPPWFTVPPCDYGGIESVIADLVEGLQTRGHRVLLIAPSGSSTAAERCALCAPPPADQLGQVMPEVVHGARIAAILAEAELDLVHDHTVAGPLLARGRNIPTVVTVHGPLEGDFLEYYRALSETVGLVSLSEAQRTRAPDLGWLATVSNGVD